MSVNKIATNFNYKCKDLNFDMHFSDIAAFQWHQFYRCKTCTKCPDCRSWNYYDVIPSSWRLALSAQASPPPLTSWRVRLGWRRRRRRLRGESCWGSF